LHFLKNAACKEVGSLSSTLFHVFNQHYWK
jgi:hypothetical protein